jgi:ABC-type Fe3+-siderophore transport system permease subunit
MELWFGHFRFVGMESLSYLIIVEIMFIAGFFWLKRDLSLFTLGSLARNWSAREKKLFTYIFCCVAVGTFVVVSLFGGFSFLGLIFPIVARHLWFKSFGLKGEFILGSLVNGLFLMGIDLLCYFLPIMGAEIPVGLVVTGVGAVSLILLLWRSRGHGIIGKA